MQDDGKPPGKGRGHWTDKGIQAQQSDDIDELKAIVAEMTARLEELETDEPTEPTP